MLKLVYYVPVKKSEIVKAALFKIGVGRIGNYDSCCFETVGQGQFRALDGANPAIGTVGKVEKVPEAKVEMVLDEELIEEAIKVLKEAHPYETPAYQVFKCLEY